MELGPAQGPCNAEKIHSIITVTDHIRSYKPGKPSILSRTPNPKSPEALNPKPYNPKPQTSTISVPRLQPAAPAATRMGPGAAGPSSMNYPHTGLRF